MELIVHMVYSCPPGGLDGIGGNKGGVCARCLWWSVGKVSTTADSWLVDVALDWHRDKYWQSTEAKIFPDHAVRVLGSRSSPSICCHMLPHSCKNRPGLLQTARCARFLLGHMSAYGLAIKRVEEIWAMDPSFMLPSGNLMGKSQFLMGKSTINGHFQ